MKPLADRDTIAHHAHCCAELACSSSKGSKRTIRNPNPATLYQVRECSNGKPSPAISFILKCGGSIPGLIALGDIAAGYRANPNRLQQTNLLARTWALRTFARMWGRQSRANRPPSSTAAQQPGRAGAPSSPAAQQPGWVGGPFRPLSSPAAQQPGWVGGKRL